MNLINLNLIFFFYSLHMNTSFCSSSEDKKYLNEMKRMSFSSHLGT